MTLTAAHSHGNVENIRGVVKMLQDEASLDAGIRRKSRELTSGTTVF